MQPAVIVGLISTISGCALQEDIVRIARSFIARGQDILGMRPGAAFLSSHVGRAAADMSVADQTVVDPAKLARHAPQPFGAKDGLLFPRLSSPIGSLSTRS